MFPLSPQCSSVFRRKNISRTEKYWRLQIGQGVGHYVQCTAAGVAWQTFSLMHNVVVVYWGWKVNDASEKGFLEGKGSIFLQGQVVSFVKISEAWNDSRVLRRTETLMF